MTASALIFDFDGLIVDTETPIMRSWQELYRSFGEELPVELWLQCVGTFEPLFVPTADLERRLGRPLDWDALEPERKAREAELIAEAPLLPGVRAHLDAARGAGVRLAVASSSTYAWVSRHLAERDVLGYFDAFANRDDVAATKPAPDLWLLALDRLGVEACDAVAIEDSKHGLVSAKLAGLGVAIVPNELTAAEDFSAADVVVDSLADISPAELWDIAR